MFGLFALLTARDDVAAGAVISRRARRRTRTCTSTCGGCAGSRTPWSRRRRISSTRNIFYPEPRHARALGRDARRGAGRGAAGLGRHEAGARAQPDDARRDRGVGRRRCSRSCRYLTGSRGAGRDRRHRVRVRAVPLRTHHAHGAAVDDVDAAGVSRAAPHASTPAAGNTGSPPARASRSRCCRASTTASSSRRCSALGALLLVARDRAVAVPSRGSAARRRRPARRRDRRRVCAYRICRRRARMGDRPMFEVGQYSARPVELPGRDTHQLAVR